MAQAQNLLSGSEIDYFRGLANAGLASDPRDRVFLLRLLARQAMRLSKDRRFRQALEAITKSSLPPRESALLARLLAEEIRDGKILQEPGTITEKSRYWLVVEGTKEIFDLEKLITAHAVYACQGKGGLSRRVRERIYSYETGKTWKALKEFPARLRSVADEVERVGRGAYFNPRDYTSKTPDGRASRREFARLPEAIRRFGEYVEFRIKQAPREAEPYFPSAKRGHSRYVYVLSLVVKECTGRYRDREVAELLEAGALALGNPGFRIDVQTLQKLRSHRKRTYKKT